MTMTTRTSARAARVVAAATAAMLMTAPVATMSANAIPLSGDQGLAVGEPSTPGSAPDLHVIADPSPEVKAALIDRARARARVATEITVHFDVGRTKFVDKAKAASKAAAAATDTATAAVAAKNATRAARDAVADNRRQVQGGGPEEEGAGEALVRMEKVDKALDGDQTDTAPGSAVGTADAAAESPNDVELANAAIKAINKAAHEDGQVEEKEIAPITS